MGPRMMSGQFFVVLVRVHQLSVSPNTSHPMIQISRNFLGYITPMIYTCSKLIV